MDVAIHVLSWDGQSIPGSRDIVIRGTVCMCSPNNVLGWSEYLGSRNTQTRGLFTVLLRDGQIPWEFWSGVGER